MKITFLGGGNMASALIGGMIERGFAAGDIQVVELGDAARAALEGRFGVRAVAGFDAVALACDILVLAVKPQQMKAALAPLAGQLAGQLVISIAAGLALDTLSMGMSHDIEPAIAEGATIVRVGTAIFGERVKPVSTPVSAGSA